MDTNIDFRIARNDDLEHLSQMRWQAREEGGEGDPLLDQDNFVLECARKMQVWMDAGSHTYWIACIDELILAHIAVHRVDLIPRPMKLHDCFGVITENYTRSEHRNQGIGTQLIRKVIEWARGQDYELLLVYPSERARPHYARAGFSDDNETMQIVLRDYIP